jgi:hypothetical protein
MASGSYDHPSYLTRQSISMAQSAGAASTLSNYTSFISDMRVRKASNTVRVAGTTTGAASGAQLIAIGTYISGFGTAGGTVLTTNVGTNTLATFTLGTSLAGAVTTSTDMNVRIVAGCVLAIKNATDATVSSDTRLEVYIDPEGQWTGPNN